MRRALLLALVLTGCHRTPPAWPAGLTADLAELRIARDGREARVYLGPHGIWRESAPHQGEADPHSVNSLLGVLEHPQFAAPAQWSGARGEVRTRIELRGRETHVVEVEAARLGEPVPLVLDGHARFLGAPLELSTKIPAPEEFIAPALWMSAEQKATSMKVSGRSNYSLTRDGDEWRSEPPAHPGVDLDDFPGAITGRQVVRFPPPGPPERFGLDHPVLTAVLCVGATCRTFRFGEQVEDGVVHAYAQAPDTDLAELRDDVWRMLLRGP